MTRLWAFAGIARSTAGAAMAPRPALMTVLREISPQGLVTVREPLSTCEPPYRHYSAGIHIAGYRIEKRAYSCRCGAYERSFFRCWVTFARSAVWSSAVQLRK